MAQYKNSGLDGKALAERKSKRLEEALSAYTPEQTKQTVSKLLEDFVDESGKNYFGAGTRDTTLYFADDEYVREIEKEKAKDKVKENKAEKKSVVDKLHKLTSILPNTENEAEEKSEKNLSEAELPDKEMFYSDENVGIKIKNSDDETKNVVSREEVTEESDKENEDETLTESSAVISEEETEPKVEKKVGRPEPEPTIVITPVRTEVSKEEDTEKMRREFFDNEIEVEAVPRRRRKQADAEVPVEEKKAPEISLDDIDDDYEEDFEEEKKSKFGNFFKRKQNEDPFDDDFDDDDFDDDDFEYDDDDYDYEEGAFTFKKVLNAIVIIALICSTAFFAASNYSNIKKLESANTQINELNNGASGSSEEQINELKAKVDELTAENEKLKSGNVVNANSSELTSVASNGTNSTTISGVAPSEDGNTNSGSGTTYTIKAGDTGSKICKAVYGQYTDELWQKILSANGMTTSSVYHPGDTLQIP